MKAILEALVLLQIIVFDLPLNDSTSLCSSPTCSILAPEIMTGTSRPWRSSALRYFEGNASLSFMIGLIRFGVEVRVLSVSHPAIDSRLQTSRSYCCAGEVRIP